MGLCEDPTTHPKNQDKGISAQNKRRTRRPRSRICLLKGCGRAFRPNHPQARYCSEHCRNQAAKWRQWKARQRYRQTAHGKEVRRAQSRRYRVRRKERKKQKADLIQGARVITRKFFFMLLRSPGMIRRIQHQTAVAAAALLFLCMSSRPGARFGSGEALVGTSPKSSMNFH
jgi:hypothetical protein